MAKNTFSDFKTLALSGKCHGVHSRPYRKKENPWLCSNPLWRKTLTVVSKHYHCRVRVTGCILDRWYGSLAAGALSALQGAPPARPGPPALALLLENCHRLHALLHATRTEPYRKEAKARYQEALNSYVQASFGQPLEKLQKFFQGVEEAVAQGTPEAEICYRQQFSKHELRKILALYPAQEVRKSLHRLYRQVEKQLSTEGGLLQVVWRAMQQQLLATHSALQARIAACYPGAGLALPLTTQDILDAFSDIAREN
ncbi:unnamed protein product [Plutella xylostella]|uniref:(diamondback moth) hypothetical protein n=1 Tax=Plutella xylostella TaxID=51655 RepID=A0A8S4G609_PLUXY|nr:unnamed protein product [Plutella xylostella]